MKSKTIFKLVFESSNVKIDILAFKESLPTNFEVEEKTDGLYVAIPSPKSEDKKCQYLIDRELDRYFFLTVIRIKAVMIKKTVYKDASIKFDVLGALPKSIGKQQWITNYELPIQLKLWREASNTQDIYLQAILLFQIIELAIPNKSNFPDYLDENIAPAPLTEAKFLRHLVVHSGDVDGKQLRRYCNYLGIPELMFDPTETMHEEILRARIKLIREEAQRLIEKSISYK